ncbi:MAG: hypothetical protein PHE52_00750 [Candidatus Pacebacteria bacterium]|nr:hypothetical protein [Candidatus Paceibacterota bacterium]
MKFLMALVKIIILFAVLPAFIYAFGSADTELQGIVILSAVALIVFLIVIKRIYNSKLPGGNKGAAIQGVWVLEKHFRFDPMLKKYESLPVEEKKNYFEFKGDKFRSGDFDEKQRQLPAEYSPFSIDGDNLILESEFFKTATWKWSVRGGKLELIGETTEPYSKSQFVFNKKN